MARTREQALAALAAGNEIRMARAATKRQLKTGEVLMDSLLLDLPPHVRKVQIGELLSWCPGMGRTRNGTKTTKGTKLRRVTAGVVLDVSLPAEALPRRHRQVLASRVLPYQLARIPAPAQVG